jgi:ABC-2 type transport system ATP-binding protein
MADVMNKAIEARGVCAARSGSRIVHEASLEVEQGTWFGLIGANGCGKTTLLRAISGRLDIEAGELLVRGQNLEHSRFARADAIDFSPTAESLPTLLTPRKLFALIAKDWRAGMGDIYDALAIEAFADLAIGRFSAGMRQRVAIASAFASNRDIIVLDEPFNWLDPVAAFDLRAALRAKVSAGLTLVTALHDMATLATCCDKGVLMHNGRIVSEIGPEILRAGQNDIGQFEQQMVEMLRNA